MLSAPFILAIDLEATCDASQLPRDQREIIEVGAVLIDVENVAKVSEFQSFVRPVKTTTLTEYCRELTSISQQDVDSAQSFPEVLGKLNAFLEPYQDPTFCAWGDYDFGQFKRDCSTHGVTFPFNRNIDVSNRFRRLMNLDRRPSLKDASALIELEWLGTQHRAIADARCLAEIILHLLPKLRADEGLS